MIIDIMITDDGAKRRRKLGIFDSKKPDKHTHTHTIAELIIFPKKYIIMQQEIEFIYICWKFSF